MAAELISKGLTVIGITGSSGKTSTKDLLAAVLAPLGEVVAPPGSFNNELGHPWTVLRATPSTDYLVLELSARHPGNIAALAAIAPPRSGWCSTSAPRTWASSALEKRSRQPKPNCRKLFRTPEW
ncbi:mur ligase middle domain protein [Mycobacterium xenopi 4042]|uniref:Mur ligase middle domain protein n=1 Tax=Mycobacterium xenopi 4042 TaxID=1299334 RepID=X7ZXI6_MYCXE|nr:mur ligase middle domain protein [Mycobacterium xenopi 4042]